MQWIVGRNKGMIQNVTTCPLGFEGHDVEGEGYWNYCPCSSTAISNNGGIPT